MNEPTRELAESLPESITAEAQARTLGQILESHRARLDRIESKLDDANNRLAILLELLRP